MTVAELIERLRSYPQDAKVVIPNRDAWLNGDYFVTNVTDYEHGTVMIETDYEELLDEGW